MILVHTVFILLFLDQFRANFILLGCVVARARVVVATQILGKTSEEGSANARARPQITVQE